MYLWLTSVSIAAVAQSVVRRIGSAEVTGPIPVSSSIYRNPVTLYCVPGFCIG